MDDPDSLRLDVEPVVAVLRWPAEEARRLHLAERGVPRLLLLGEDEAPPSVLDDLEDWVRAPLSAADLAVRAEPLRRRAALGGAPVLDDDGLLRFRGAWVTISDAQLPVVDLLVARFGSLVRTEEILVAYGAANRKTVSTVLFRLRSRFAEVGLTLRVVRRRGAILEA